MACFNEFLTSLNSLQIVELWSNPDPTAEVPSKTNYNINASDYDTFIIQFIEGNSYRNNFEEMIAFKNINHIMMFPRVESRGYAYSVYTTRKFTITDTQLKITSIAHRASGNYANYVIPTKLWGVYKK